jgi:ligand-binding sensor domain-containing protein/sensor histidine kinase YesM
MKASKLITVAICFSVALQAQAQNFVTYSLAQGLPQSQVFATVQDSKGFMWFGTQGGGICRFDGLDFQTFTTDNGLPSNYVNAIFEDADKRLWVGTNAGVCYFNGKVFEKIPAVESRGLQVLCFCQTRKGGIWLGTDRGIFVCNPVSKTVQQVLLPNIPESIAVWALLPTERGIWIGTDAGAFRTGDQPVRLTTKNGLLSNGVRAFAKTWDGHFWIATSGGGVVVYDEGQSQVSAQYPNPAWTTCLLPDAAGKIWIGTSDNGVAVFNPADSTWTQTTERQGFPHQYVRSMACDNAGNIWVGTSGGGVVKFMESQPFSHFGASHGLAGSRVYALEKNANGGLLLAVSQVGLQVIDSSGIAAFERDSGWLTGVKSRSIATDNFGRVWVGTEGKGVVVFDSSGMFNVAGLPNNIIQKIIPGAPGDMWVATSNGIARINYALKNSFNLHLFGKEAGLKGLIINTMHLDNRSNLWFADQLGNVGLIQNGKLERFFGQENGLPGTPVRCIATNAAGHLWVGTKGAGIFEADPNIDPVRFQPIHTPKKLASDNIYLLVFDLVGNLWAGSESGVDKISFANNSAIISDNQHFGKNEGFLGIETCQDAALCDRAGNLWFGTMNGLMKYSPSNRKTTGAAPILHFEDITLFYKPLEQTKYARWVKPLGGLYNGLELPWNENHLSFEFRAVDLAHPDALQYRWKLDGAPNTGWSPLSSQPSVNFAGLQPGEYTFSVQATSDGSLFSETISASFSVKKPFWQLLGFQLLVALGLVGVGILLARSRIRRIKKAEKAKRTHLELQNHLLQLEQKALQLQMNPHFLFNALNSIQSLISAGDTQQARTQIGHFAQLMRGILNNSRQSYISLKEETETLEQYLRIEQFCQQNKFEFNIKLPENVDAEELEIPPMMLQPFVENAVVHGISHLNWPGKIDILFSIESGLLTCIIRDNGIGREKAARLRQERKPGHQSVAIHVTRDRLEALKVGANYQALTIEDIKDDAGEIVGTIVTVRMPVKVNF